MTAINLPGQLEVPLVVDHSAAESIPYVALPGDYGIAIAKLLQSYEERPSSETWTRIQALAKEILR